MHPLLRYTLDLFESDASQSPEHRPTLKAFKPLARMEPAQAATELIANEVSDSLLLATQSPGQAVAPIVFAHPRANRQIRLGHAVVGYVLERAKRRSIGFVVGPDGLVVRAPRWTTVQEFESALHTKADWILRKLAQGRERHTRQQEAHIEWRDGATLPFLGETVVLKLDPGHHFAGAGAQLQGPDARTLCVALPTHATADQIRDVVQAWLMRQALAHFKQRLDHFAPLLQVKWQRLSLSNASTRWGSARADGAIRLNWRLIHLRPRVVDYVVAHELSHLRVMDHSPRFWDTVREVVPDYALLRNQLKEGAVPRW